MLLEEPTLEILYQDADIVAVNKPPGLLVHRSSIAADATVFALQRLRRQLQQKVYPAHRLDRKTSGVLLFALNKETASLLQTQFQEQQIEKKYLAIVRGYFPESIELDYALTNDRNKKQEAVTHFRKLQTTEIPLPFGDHQTSRYSLIEAIPKTGRMHQIRKHCKHLRHPIIGDRPYGCNKQNKLFKEHWQMMTMLLHAVETTFSHPKTGEVVTIDAPLQEEFRRMLETLGFEMRGSGLAKR